MKTQILGFLTPWIIYTCITLLHILLPARRIQGYARHDTSNEILQYRINGFQVLVLSILTWLILGKTGWVPYTWLYTVRWYSLAGAAVLGLAFSLIMVLPYPSTGKSLIPELFLGRSKNPQYKNGFIDAKMWLYMIGAVMLQLNVLSFTAYHYLHVEQMNPGVLLCAAMLTWFVWDYLTFEKVHLYTYDFIAERVGLKLGFGCLTFYPYFYLIALWATVDRPDPGTSTVLLILYGLIFLSGWMLARGANMQKYTFKTRPGKKFLGMEPATLSDGNKMLLVNGFWGLSRHINYLGEILMATGIALSTGYPALFWVWLYPLYYVLLLFPRQRDDDRICRDKYGELWERYTDKVKYRIIPFLY
jgi:protein-S-isoprenylcysteine O-methyltransferase Ste14